MAPPRTIKQPSSKIVKSNSRKGDRELQKDTSEKFEMEVDEYSEEVDEMVVDEPHLDEAEPQNSQPGASDTGLQQLMVDMVDTQRKRHQQRKQAIHKEYAKSRENMEIAINFAFDDHEMKASEAHDLQFKRLQNLLEQKAKIEAAMDEKLTTLRSNYLVHSEALQKVIQYRLKELR